MIDFSNKATFYDGVSVGVLRNHVPVKQLLLYPYSIGKII